MANLEEFNKGLEALGPNPTEEAKANLKNLLANLDPEQKKKAEEEIRKRNLGYILSSETSNQSLFLFNEQGETREDSYSLEAVEDRLQSKLFKFALNRGHLGDLVQTKVEGIIDKGIFERSKSTIQVVYLDKIVSECKPGHLIYTQMTKLGGKAKSLLGGIFKPDGSFDLDGALKVGESIPSVNAEPTDSKKNPIDGVKDAYELDGETKGIIASILSDAMEKFNENLKLLNEYAKDKPGFKEVFDNPVVLSKVLEEGKYEGTDGISIDIKEKKFTYTMSGNIKSIQDTFVNQLIEKANGTGGEVDKMLNQRKTFDKILGFLGLGSLKDFIVSIFEMLGIGGLAGKGMDLLEKMTDGKTDKETYLENLKTFLNSGNGKSIVSGRTDFNQKELKNFYKVLKNVKFDKDFSGGVEDKNLWSYLLTGKDSDGKEMTGIDVNGEVSYLRKVITENIIAGENPIDSKKLVSRLNGLPKDWLKIKKDDEREKAIKHTQEEGKKLEERRIQEEKNTLKEVITKVELFLQANPTLGATSKSKIEKQVQESKDTLNNTEANLGEINSKKMALNQEFDVLKTTPGLSTPPVVVTTPPEVTQISPVVKENPFKDLPLITTIDGTEVRFEPNKKYIILGDKAYQIDDIVIDGKSIKTLLSIESLSLKDGRLNIIFSSGAEGKASGVFLLGDIKKREFKGEIVSPSEKEIASGLMKGEVHISVAPEDFKGAIAEIIHSNTGTGSYKSTKDGKTLEVKIGLVVNS